ncbi:MAG: PD-(D/E)XK nuclease family protein [Candidatus Aureabacteria bacterium]|nr:PD-(D/E)XK nuclease family protein [Candidatus Auribacterota bacterium]
MSEYYHALRSRNLYAPGSDKPYKISRTKIDLFLNCPRCFYLDRRLGIARPPSFPYSLNSAVDTLLKKEFDMARKNQSRHPLMEKFGIEAIPFSHENLNVWRENFKGIQFHHEKTNFIITGAIDDVWISPSDQLHIVDYKSTSKTSEITIDEPWQIAYKRQMEVYQWLFRKNGFQVSDTGYFVYCNGNTENEVFDAKLEFDIKILPYRGNDSWMNDTLLKIHSCLNDDDVPPVSDDCDYCSYIKAVNKVL